jgi:hypothetical protein
MLLSKLAIIAPLLLGAIAAPANSNEASHLAKRSQGIHLVNCGTRDSVVVVSGTHTPVRSYRTLPKSQYCPNDSNCDFNPSPSNYCTFDSSGLGTWEGGEKSCTFTTGVTFQWGIESNAQSKANYAFVG